MTMAISMAAQEGAKAVICVHRKHQCQCCGVRRARGHGVRGFVPAGKIAMGKPAQALVHGARLLQVDGNFDDCLTLARELSEDYPVALVNSVNPARIEGQKTAVSRSWINWERRRTSTACRSATREHHRLLDGLPGVLGQTPDGDSRQPVPP